MAIEEKIIQRNAVHFNQANETPFGSAEMQRVTGWHGLNQATQELRSGNIPEEIADATPYECADNLFRQLLQEEALPEFTASISWQEYNKAIKAWK